VTFSVDVNVETKPTTYYLLVNSDVLAAMDLGHAVTVVGLDMSSAFDAVCHQPLIDRLQSDFGVTGTCLQSITSYLSERSSSVRVKLQHPSLPVPTSVFHKVFSRPY